MTQKTVLVCGAGGFIGHHLVNRLKKEGCWVRGVDIKKPEFGSTQADEFILLDLRLPENTKKAVALKGKVFDEVYQLAANMGGVGFINSNHDAEIMHDSALINLNMAEACRIAKVKKVLYSSSACIYPERNQLDPNNPRCAENSAYPAAPDTEYGWEKLYSERLFQAYAKDYGMKTKIVRLHNIYGPQATWKGGREKAPAALCRKVAEAVDGGVIQIWGKGDQTRSFLDVDECLEGLLRIMQADHPLPALNLGSEEMISINDLAQLIIKISDKKLSIQNVEGPEGVRGRNSDNALIQKELKWQPSKNLEQGMRKLYAWINEQVHQK